MEKSPTKAPVLEHNAASMPGLEPSTWTERLEKARQEVETIADRLDLGIDPDIKEPVAVFIASGLHTTMSCEGHAEKERNPVPYIDIAAPDEPEWQYVGQRELCKKLGAENGLTAEEVLHMFSEDPAKRDLARKIGKQAWDKIDAPFTPEYAAWKQRCDEMADQLKILLAKFYQEHKADDDARLITEEMSFGHTRIRNNSPWYEKFFDWASARVGEDLSEEERKQVAERLPVYKKEMYEFAEYMQQMNALAEYDARDKPSIAEDRKFEEEVKNIYGEYTQELKLTPEDLGKRVLDVGSDYGNFAIEAKKHGYKDIYSIDLIHPADRYTIDEKIEYGAGKMTVGDVMRMPFKDEEFDLTVSFCSMPAVLAFDDKKDRLQTAGAFRKNTRAALIEMLRVTKKGGEVRLGRTFLAHEDEDMPFARETETKKVLEELKRELGIEFKTEEVSDRSLLIRLFKK